MPFWRSKKRNEDEIPDEVRVLIEQRHTAESQRTDSDLIVDDNQVNRDVLIRYLKKYNFCADQAENGMEALKMLAGGSDYDVIWIDIQMPVLNGYETTKYLRAEYPNGFGYKGIVVGVTGFADAESRQKCLDAGMTNVLTKPYAHESIKRVHTMDST